MSEEIENKKERNRYPDRLTVAPENLVKIGRLIEQFKTSCRGVDLNRKEMLNYVIASFPGELAASDLKALSVRYYDEERFLRAAIEEVRSAKSRGEVVSLETILQQKMDNVPKVRKPRKSKAEKAKTDSDDGQAPGLTVSS